MAKTKWKARIRKHQIQAKTYHIKLKLVRECFLTGPGEYIHKTTNKDRLFTHTKHRSLAYRRTQNNKGKVTLIWFSPATHIMLPFTMFP